PVRSAVGDVNGDGVEDYIVVTGPGSLVRFAVVDGRDRTTVLVPATDPFGDPSFGGGAFVAAADLDNDGRAEWLITPDQGGGPRVLVLSGQLVGSGNVSGAQSSPVANFFVAGDAANRGGVRLAARDVDGDNKADVIAASGENSPSRVRVYFGKSFTGGEPSG